MLKLCAAVIIGAVASLVTVMVFDALVPLLAMFTAASAGRLMLTLPSAVGVTTTVYTILLVVCGAATVALVNVKSVAVKPVTASLNVTVTVNGAFTLDAAVVERT